MRLRHRFYCETSWKKVNLAHQPEHSQFALYSSVIKGFVGISNCNAGNVQKFIGAYHANPRNHRACIHLCSHDGACVPPLAVSSKHIESSDLPPFLTSPPGVMNDYRGITSAYQTLGLKKKGPVTWQGAKRRKRRCHVAAEQKRHPWSCSATEVWWFLPGPEGGMGWIGGMV